MLVLVEMVNIFFYYYLILFFKARKGLAKTKCVLTKLRSISHFWIFKTFYSLTLYCVSLCGV